MHSNANTQFRVPLYWMHSFNAKIKFSREVWTYLRSLSDLILTSNSCDGGFVFCTFAHPAPAVCCRLALHRTFWVNFVFSTFTSAAAGVALHGSQRTFGAFFVTPAQHFLRLTHLLHLQAWNTIPFPSRSDILSVILPKIETWRQMFVKQQRPG